MKVLYIGGTGEISYPCVYESVALGHEVTVFNRGKSADSLPDGVTQIVGDLADPNAYDALADHHFDVICQFRAYGHDQIDRDLAAFAGKTGQYVFISSASAYHKPLIRLPITEDTPLHNPYWQYSRNKAELEAKLFEAHGQGVLPVTVVRPSHTYRTRVTIPFGGDAVLARLQQGGPVVVPGDGTSLWTVTHSDDFARPFARLLGRPESLGEAYHITDSHAYPWDRLLQIIARALGGPDPQIVHVCTEAIIRIRPDLEGPLLGDKSNSLIFDNAKIKALVGDFPCQSPEEGLPRAVAHITSRSLRPDPDMDTVLGQLVQMYST